MCLHTVIVEIGQLHMGAERAQWERRLRRERPDWRVTDAAGFSGDGGQAFLLTDDRRAADWALRQGIGFAVYLSEAGKGQSFPEALYCIEELSALDARQLERMHRRFHELPWTILETERCIVREITPEDVDALYEIYADKEISRYTEDLFESRAQELAYTKDYIKQQYRFYEYGMWVVLCKADGRLIGRAGLSGRAGYEEAELGYVIAQDCRRQGYAKEVCAAILTYAAKELAMTKLNAFTLKENAASVSLLKNLGFLRQGEADIDGVLHEQYAFLVKVD